MQPSAFTSVDLLDLSSKEPLAKRLYAVIKAALGDAFAPETPSFTDNFAYAFAMAATRSWWRKAHQKPSAEPQSWTTKTTG